MIEVKVQKHPSGSNNGKYFTYIVTLPKSIMEATPKLSKAKKLKVTLKGESIILTP